MYSFSRLIAALEVEGLVNSFLHSCLTGLFRTWIKLNIKYTYRSKIYIIPVILKYNLIKVVFTLTCNKKKESINQFIFINFLFSKTPFVHLIKHRFCIQNSSYVNEHGESRNFIIRSILHLFQKNEFGHPVSIV